mmetsp:Transcript_11221/g.27589  ORF Transcript_11221/g.27589 Transcript_11221/m.27589 type:complete len:290 (+) Transcript_11221:170-1039(+)
MRFLANPQLRSVFSATAPSFNPCYQQRIASALLHSTDRLPLARNNLSPLILRTALLLSLRTRLYSVRGGASTAEPSGQFNTVKSSTNLSVVVALDDVTYAIGNKGDLIWSLPEDMNYFKNVTSSVANPNSGLQNSVIMGRLTWESIPPRLRPLKDRINIIVSRNPAYTPEFPETFKGGTVSTAKSLPEALLLLKGGKFPNFSGQAFVIGGASLYEEALRLPECKSLYVTRVFAQLEDGQFDRFFPEIDRNIFTLKSTSEKRVSAPKKVRKSSNLLTGLGYQFEVYERKS